MFTTDMGSLAYEYIYTLYAADTAIMELMPDNKDHPSAVRENHLALKDSIMDLREKIDAEVTAWVTSVYLQERSTHDVALLDEKFDTRLSRHGIAERAWEMAFPNKTYPGLS